MNRGVTILGCVAASILALGGCATAKESAADPGQQLLDKASMSFSNLPFYTTQLPANARLNAKYDGDRCARQPLAVCSYFDANGVDHYYFDDLKIKTIEVGRVGDNAILALGIGVARRRNDVVDRISAFLGGVEFRCEDVREESDTGLDEVCNVDVGEGWVSLAFFDDRLLSVQLTSGQYI